MHQTVGHKLLKENSYILHMWHSALVTHPPQDLMCFQFALMWF